MLSAITSSFIWPFRSCVHDALRWCKCCAVVDHVWLSSSVVCMLRCSCRCCIALVQSSTCTSCCCLKFFCEVLALSWVITFITDAGYRVALVPLLLHGNCLLAMTSTVVSCVGADSTSRLRSLYAIWHSVCFKVEPCCTVQHTMLCFGTILCSTETMRTDQLFDKNAMCV